MAFDVSRLTRLPLAYYCAAFFGLAVALLALAAPLWQLERGVLASGVHHVIHAAKPPLGLKARSLLAMLAGFGTALAIVGPFLILQAIKARKRPPISMPKRSQWTIRTLWLRRFPRHADPFLLTKSWAHR